MQPELEARFTYNPENWTFPSGVHVAAVEVARDTGTVRVLGYWVAHDCGTMLNPMLVDGQIHGGLAQGIGGALSEELRYDDAGQLLSGTFMDYAIPTADYDAADHDRSRGNAVAAHAGRDERHGRGRHDRRARDDRERRRGRAGRRRRRVAAVAAYPLTAPKVFALLQTAAAPGAPPLG